ncbi:MAG: metal-dependent hydrolase [Hyphomonas sp.]|uniref:metal-dependent hydrolase n=1 Tax=Hyphomonas sp. TaxID=87 RepID=UPI003527CB51
MTNKRTPEDVTILPRDLHFDMSAADNGPWLDGDPVATAVFNALSLTFPDGERMFMDSVKAYRNEVSGKLAQDVKDFVTQEAIHSREHHLLNNKIDRQKYPVHEIEAAIREKVAFSRDGGPFRMLIGTICLEHFTAMMADLMMEMHTDYGRLFSKTDPALERLWRWHAMEETEHKAVAYDVFLEVTKDWPPFKRYFRRSLSMLIITGHFTHNIAGYAVKLLEADGYETKEAQRAVNAFLWKKPSLFGKGWKIWLSWFKPGFHPWDHDNRAEMAAWKEDFNPAQVAAE